MSRRFPGMDPYLEAPGIWPDFHEAMAFCIREVLQPLLPAHYYAALRTREEIGVGLEGDAVLYSEIALKRAVQSGSSGDVVRESPVAGACEHLVIAVEPLRLSFVEIRTTGPGGRLVTLIEIDLLRNGQRHGGHPRVHAHCAARGHDYVVVVSRAAARQPRLDLELYGFTVRDPLPTVAVPLAP